MRAGESQLTSCPRKLDAAALMVESGVRNSCETEDKRMDFKWLLSSRTLARDSASTSQARSSANAPWLANVFSNRFSLDEMAGAGLQSRISPITPRAASIGAINSGKRAGGMILGS